MNIPEQLKRAIFSLKGLEVSGFWIEREIPCWVDIYCPKSSFMGFADVERIRIATARVHSELLNLFIEENKAEYEEFLKKFP